MSPKKAFKILMVGLNAAGKTRMLYKMKSHEDVATMPTIGFNLETVEYKDKQFEIYDIGGHEKVRQLWQKYCRDCHGIMFVVDCSDRLRIQEAKQMLVDVLADDELREAVLLVYANKTSFPNAMAVDEVTEELGLNTLENRNWHIQTACAASGEGIDEGLDWLLGKLDVEE